MKPVISHAIDVRQLRLSKWILPKTNSISSLRLHNQVGLSASYFDAVEVLKMKDIPMPLSDQTSDNLFHTKHGLYLYTPTTRPGDRRRIQNFWRRQAKSSEPLYVCMVRLTDEDLTPEKLHNHIDWAFHDQAGIPRSKVLCYYSLAFCDLVLFAQGVRFSQHLAAVDILNFRVQESGTRIVRDTISIYSVRPDVLTDSLPFGTQAPGGDLINFTLRLGVLNFACLEEFQRAVQQKLFPDGTDPDVHCEMSLGRSDFTLYARRKDYPWIVSFCRVLDQFTSDENSGFLTFDISVGADYDSMVAKIQCAGYPAETGIRSSMYQKALELSPLCAKCRELLKEVSIESSYLSEIQLALTDLLKDGFAQDLVLSIYEPFWHLIDYIIYLCHGNERLDLSDAERRRTIQALLEAYAVSLATIVNCTMHSDREFIQVPSFNLFLQSVPPKLLAFYTAAANQIAKRLTEQDQECARFTFLFMPSYKDGINVNSLMPPHEIDSRILAVSVQEKLLTTPDQLLPLIGHEIAHYAGRKTRNRELRTDCYLNSLLAYELDLAFFSISSNCETDLSLFDLCTQFAQSLREVVITQYSLQFQDHHFTALLESVLNSRYLLDILTDDAVMQKATSCWAKILEQQWNNGGERFAREWIKRLDGYTQTKYLSGLADGERSRRECLRIICEWCYRQISVSFDDLSEYEALSTWYDWLKCAYREGYSDIVMLYLLGITDMKEYWRIIRENLRPNDSIEYNKLRSSAVTAALGGDDPGWMELDIDAPVFQQCAFRWLTEYLQTCRFELGNTLGHTAPPLAQTYQKLRPEKCDAEELFILFREQSRSYQKHLCELPAPGQII